MEFGVAVIKLLSTWGSNCSSRASQARLLSCNYCLSCFVIWLLLPQTPHICIFFWWLYNYLLLCMNVNIKYRDDWIYIYILQNWFSMQEIISLKMHFIVGRSISFNLMIRVLLCSSIQSSSTNTLLPHILDKKKKITGLFFYLLLNIF